VGRAATALAIEDCGAARHAADSDEHDLEHAAHEDGKETSRLRIMGTRLVDSFSNEFCDALPSRRVEWECGFGFFCCLLCSVCGTRRTDAAL
jgi:hypothetical protein